MDNAIPKYGSDLPRDIPFQMFPENVPLPEQNFEGADADPDSTLWKRAYQYCCHMEVAAGRNVKLLMYSRVLGYMLLEAPSPSGRTFIAREIAECLAKSVDVNLLAELYVHYVFGILRRPAEPFDKCELVGALNNKYVSVGPKTEPTDEATAKSLALHRDGHSCMVSGNPDEIYFRCMTPAQQIAFLGNRPLNIEVTRLCHIIPPSVDWDLDPEEYGYPTTKRSKTLGRIVEGFAGIDVAAELSGDKAYRLSNNMTVSVLIRDFFHLLFLWFEEVPKTQNTYIVRTLRRAGVMMDIPRPHVFTFKTSTDMPLPDPRYLRFHAAICRVAHLANVYFYFASIDWDREVVARDRTHASVMTTRRSHTL